MNLSNNGCGHTVAKGKGKDPDLSLGGGTSFLFEFGLEHLWNQGETTERPPQWKACRAQAVSHRGKGTRELQMSSAGHGHGHGHGPGGGKEPREGSPPTPLSTSTRHVDGDHIHLDEKSLDSRRIGQCTPPGPYAATVGTSFALLHRRFLSTQDGARHIVGAHIFAEETKAP